MRRPAFLVASLGLLLISACSSTDPAPDRVWYTAGAQTAPTPCLPKEDPQVSAFLEKTWGKSGTRCVKRIDYGPETNSTDDRGDPATATTCLYGVIWRDC